MSNSLGHGSKREEFRHVRLFLLLDLACLLIVFGWIPFLPISGGEYGWWLCNYSSGDGGVASFISLNAVVIGCRVINISLMYSIMVLLFFTTRFLIQGPWWLGSLSAVLFMSHPLVHSSVMRCDGFATLFGVLCTIFVVFVFSYVWFSGHIWYMLLVGGVSIFNYFYGDAVMASSVCMSVGIGSFFLPKVTIRRDALFKLLVGILFLLGGIIMFVRDRGGEMFISDWIPSISLFLYPIGWLKDTQMSYFGTVSLRVLYNLLFLFMMMYICWRVKNMGITLLTVILLISIWMIHPREVNLSNPLFNNKLLSSLAMFSMLFSGFCGVVQKQPRWNSAIVKGTTLLCIMLMGSQIFLNGLFVYNCYMEKKVARKALTAMNDLHGRAVLLFPSSIRYRWSIFELGMAIARDLDVENRSDEDVIMLQVGDVHIYDSLNLCVETVEVKDNRVSFVLASQSVHRTNEKVRIVDVQPKDRCLYGDTQSVIAMYTTDEQIQVNIVIPDDKSWEKFLLWDFGKNQFMIIPRTTNVTR